MWYAVCHSMQHEYVHNMGNTIKHSMHTHNADNADSTDSADD